MQNTLKIIVKFLNLALDVLANVLDEEETDQDLILPSQISSQPTPTKDSSVLAHSLFFYKILKMGLNVFKIWLVGSNRFTTQSR